MSNEVQAADQPVQATGPARGPLDIPSIAVLPFQNLSSDPEQEYFADGIVEEIIGALSRFRHLFVTARNSSFSYKGRVVNLSEVGAALGVRYVLEGSVRRSTDRVRIAGQLAETATGKSLWADRFEAKLNDIFELQGRVTASVVGAIAPKVQEAEIERVRRKATESLDAYDFYLRALPFVHQWTPESTGEALRFLYRAIELDPDFASAHGVAAWCYVRRKISGWLGDSAREMSELERLARRAVESANADALALACGGFALAQLPGCLDQGAAVIERALVFNPNLALGWFLSGWTKIYRAEPRIAIEHFACAMRLNPLDPLIYRMQTGTAAGHFLLRQYKQASLWAEKAIACHPTDLASIRMAAASYALSGEADRARLLTARIHELDPDATLSGLEQAVPFRRPDDITRYRDALRAAGYPQ